MIYNNWLTWTLVYMLRIYIKCNPTVKFLKYNFNNKSLVGITLIKVCIYIYIYIYIFIYNELGYLTQENPFERVNALCFTVNRDFFSPWIACFSFLWMKKFAKVKKKRLRQKMVKSITGLPPTPHHFFIFIPSYILYSLPT